MMDEKKIVEAIEQYCITINNRKVLSCPYAFQIAQEQNVDVSIIGNICNEGNIKLQKCQLGCF
jgi:hypothetical protein